MLRIGTCSWKYPSWKGLVYSKATGVDYLAEYATRYDTVEVDQWFWNLPEPATAAQYASVTPADFRFTIKLPNTISLTHFYKKKGETSPRPNPEFLSVTLFQDVLARLEPLHAKIGILMLQFEYLNAQKMGSQEEFLARLGAFVSAVPRTLPLAIEPRNPFWINRRYFEFLAERQLSHVFLQGYYMPSMFEAWGRYRGLVRGPVVVRLHGPDREGIERETGEHWDQIVAPKDEELARLVRMMEDMRDRSLTVYLNVNNHYEGSAPRTIERLRERGVTSQLFPA
ncbi:MAG: DUF72 domain-containing protein [Spirochaetia bacterium]